MPLFKANETLLVRVILYKDYPQHHPNAAEATHNIEYRFPTHGSRYDAGKQNGQGSSCRCAHIDDGRHDHTLSGWSP